MRLFSRQGKTSGTAADRLGKPRLSGWLFLILFGIVGHRQMAHSTSDANAACPGIKKVTFGLAHSVRLARVAQGRSL